MKAALVLLSSICFWYLAHKYWVGTRKPNGYNALQPNVSDTAVVWRGQAGISLIGAITAISDFVNPPTPPFTGRWSAIYSVIFDSLGPYGCGFLWTLASTLLAMSAWKNYKQRGKDIK